MSNDPIQNRQTRRFANFGRIFSRMDFKRDQLETRVATLELMLVTERARPMPDKEKIKALENQLTEARLALQNYRDEHP